MDLSVGTVIAWLRIQVDGLYGDETLGLLPNGNKCINVLGDYADK